MDIRKSEFLRDWKNQNIGILQTMHPDISDKIINDFLDEVINDNIVLKEGFLHNNYNNRKITVDTLSIIDWYRKKKPVVAGHGCFFKNQKQEKNPSAIMQDKFLKLRKEYKDKMFTFPEEDYSHKAFDRKQRGEKINVNSLI